MKRLVSFGLMMLSFGLLFSCVHIGSDTNVAKSSKEGLQKLKEDSIKKAYRDSLDSIVHIGPRN